ncbi:response regulator [Leptothoe sp. ISB3NOV94-8A]
MFNSLSNTTTEDVLIIDDTPVNLQLLSSMLLEAGYQVRQAVNGQQALKSLDKNIPDLILLDIMMPEITGYELCKQLKSSEKTKDIPIIFISSLDDAFDKVLAFDVGGADYITKPFRVQEVIARVQNQLTLRQQEKLLQNRYEQLQQEVCDLKIGEEDLYVDLHALAQGLHTVARQMSMKLTALLKDAQQGVMKNENHRNNFDEQQRPIEFQSLPDIRISTQVIEQMIENCDQQLNSIDTITRLVNPTKLQ